MPSPVFCSGVSVVRSTPAVSTDPLRYVKSSATSPLAVEARQTIDQLQRQKQQGGQVELQHDADNWQAVL